MGRMRTGGWRWGAGCALISMTLAFVVGIVVSLVTRDEKAEQMFESKVQTSDNRVSAIAAGFEKAVAETMGKLVAWTNASGRTA